jgi:hypothetical protein
MSLHQARHESVKQLWTSYLQAHIMELNTEGQLHAPYSFTSSRQIARHRRNRRVGLHCVRSSEEINTRRMEMESTPIRLPWSDKVFKRNKYNILNSTVNSTPFVCFKIFSQQGYIPTNITLTGNHCLLRIILLQCTTTK